MSDLPTLSVLDLAPVRSDQSSAEAIRATLALARVAEEAGYHRYWVAEHHNMPAVAATNPPILISLIASATNSMRVGSGGVMLPNHAPLVVAEQFALLEAAFPGRIDLGIGRAPGSDPVTSWALRQGGSDQTGDDAVNRFGEYVDNVMAMMSASGAVIALPRQSYELRATPQARSVSPVWLLGSSDYSARLAAQKGLPYVFAHHFSGQGTADALALYRQNFVPSQECPEPRTLLTVNAVVAPTVAEAERFALPNALQMLALRTGGTLQAQRLVHQAEAVDVPPAHQGLIDSMLRRWVIGDPAQARQQVTDLAAEFDIDEVMVHPVAGAVEGTDPGSSPAREETLSLLTAG